MQTTSGRRSLLWGIPHLWIDPYLPASPNFDCVVRLHEIEWRSVYKNPSKTSVNGLVVSGYFQLCVN